MVDDICKFAVDESYLYVAMAGEIYRYKDGKFEEVVMAKHPPFHRKKKRK